MGRAMTITEKILAAHAGKEQVEPGELINARVDLVLGNDITAPVAIKEFEKIGVDQVFDRDAVALVPDHFTPNKDIKSAEQAKKVREFAKEYGITNYFEVGRMGIEHCLYPNRAGRTRRYCDRSGFSHLHLWSAGRLFYRGRQY